MVKDTVYLNDLRGLRLMSRPVIFAPSTDDKVFFLQFSLVKTSRVVDSVKASCKKKKIVYYIYLQQKRLKNNNLSYGVF